MSDLDREFLEAAKAVTAADMAFLARMGVSVPTLARDRYGFMRVETDAATYQPHEHGRRALVLPCGDLDHGIDDMVCMFSDQPERWWSRRGDMPVLGEEEVLRASIYETPLKLYSTPWAWFVGGGDGAVFLDWTRDAGLWLAGVPEVRCDTPMLARRLQTKLEERRLPFPVTAANRTRRAAA